MRYSKAFPGTTKEQDDFIMSSYQLLHRSKREPGHFAFVSFHWFFGGIMVIDDEQDPYY